MSTPTPVTILGSTGLTGSETLHALLTSSHPFSITTATRRPIPSPFPKCKPTNAQTVLDERIYPSLFDAPADTARGKLVQEGGVYVSCLATTRVNGKETQKKVDWELNRDLATRAKADGARTAILVSGSHASPDSSFFYLRIKGQLEEHLTTLGFNHVVILKPGMLLGHRERVDWAEIGLQKLFGWARWAGVGTDALAVDGKDVGACIANLIEYPPLEKHLILGNRDIIARARLLRASR
ncbi:hypothetical protein L202_07168 [Cryptococcus amylolentus CBS 6039]|uniref:NAD(P)-binding domain-containing protein n=1 Tax=Cryptococcus amylolentus CBS 6039 TaxID=1295533 RepID=A0A1E3HEX1_9TREE|nr:hypothetical protein L202_07168 [Cryptococcus amylolentus CBS 6039]ODN74864.1 hypothetical protein L202_07168 [Cryptococcus amylolentus CBS 6039]